MTLFDLQLYLKLTMYSQEVESRFYSKRIWPQLLDKYANQLVKYFTDTVTLNNDFYLDLLSVNFENSELNYRRQLTVAFWPTRRPRINAGYITTFEGENSVPFIVWQYVSSTHEHFVCKVKHFRLKKIISRQLLRKKSYFGWTFRSCSSSNISCSSSDLYKLFLSFMWPLIASSPGTIVFAGIIHWNNGKQWLKQYRYDDISEPSIFQISVYPSDTLVV